MLASPVARAAPPGEAQAQKGLWFARRRDCTKAVPLLVEAEKLRHRPSTAIALADCRVALGELIQASEIYREVIEDKPQRFWVRTDYNARKAAQKKADAVDKRIPTLRFELPTPYKGLSVEVDGKAVTDLDEQRRVSPDVSIQIVASAEGQRPISEKIVLTEGEHRVFVLRLAAAEETPRRRRPRGRSTHWFGARYYGVVIPKPVMNIIADGGRTLAVPGGAFAYTTLAADAEVTIALGFLSYRMGETPFKPHKQPDTEWEIVSSTLSAATLTVDLMWPFPLDDAGRVSFRIGGAAGVGWMFLGDLRRVQAYPKNGKQGDPSTYLPCAGPNKPFGTFRYCNALDKDADHYPGYSEPDWFHRGIRPLVFPWLVLPQVGFSFRPTDNLAIDLDTGISLSGIVTSLGFRVGL